MNYANIYTKEIAEKLPEVPAVISVATGKTFDPTDAQKAEWLLKVGWREVKQVQAAPDGLVVTAYMPLDAGDGKTCTLAVAKTADPAVLAAEEQAKAEQLAQEQADAELAEKEHLAEQTAQCLLAQVLVALIGEQTKLTSEGIYAEARKQLGLVGK